MGDWYCCERIEVDFVVAIVALAGPVAGVVVAVAALLAIPQQNLPYL